jgi:putative Mg2+ transporter-C (MgtC) family protein
MTPTAAKADLGLPEENNVFTAAAVLGGFMYLESIPLLSELNIYSITVKILLALLLGGLLGIEREQKRHPAGFRTYMIVCLGSTLACITNIYMCQYSGSTDPARIPAQVISGIGFLGAGTILVTRNNHIKGLTTAAGLWCCATIGIAIGSGFYSGAILCAIAIFFSLRILTLVDNHFTRFNKYVTFYVEYQNPSFIRCLIEYCKSNDYSLQDIEIYRATVQNEVNSATFSIKTNNPRSHEQVVYDIRQLNGVLFLEKIL